MVLVPPGHLVHRSLRRALAEAKRIRKWWRKKRLSAPRLFEDELEAIIERALINPTLGVLYARR